MLQHRGFVEAVSEDAVAGWCWDSDHPQVRLDVDILLDGAILASSSACNLRADLVRAGFGDGRYGFRITLPNNLTEDEQWRIVVNARSENRSVILPRTATQAEAPSPKRTGTFAQRLPRCIVHIGTEKTGSTSLQAFFGRRRKDLSARGIFVPLSFSTPAPSGVINHTELVSYSYDISTVNQSRFNSGEPALTPSAIRAARAALQDTLCNELQQALSQAESPYHTMIFSCELLHNRLLLQEELVRLHNLLSEFADTVEVLVYVRPQHEMAVSLFSTALENGSTEENIVPRTEGAPGHMRFLQRLYDFDALVARWQAAFGPECVRVRLYCSDVVGDFAQMLAASSPSEPGIDALGEATPRLNRNLSASAQRTLLCLNRNLAKAANHEARQLRNVVVTILKDSFPGQSALPARSDAEHFQDFFEDSNAKLCARVFPGRSRLFDLDFSKYPGVATSLQATTDEMGAVIVAILRAHRNIS